MMLRENDQQIEFRHAVPDLDEALEQEVRQPAIIALDRAGDDADDGGDRRQGEAEQHRQAEPVDHAGQDIACLVIRAQQIRPEGGEGAGLGRSLTMVAKL